MSFGFWTDVCLRTEMTVFLYSLGVESDRFWTVVVFVGSDEWDSLFLSDWIDLF